MVVHKGAKSMFKTVVTIAVLLVSVNVSANWLAGDWHCIAELHEKYEGPQPEASFELHVNNEVSKFVRHSEMSIPTGLYQLPIVTFAGVEEGVVIFEDDYLRLAPLDVDMEFITGKVLAESKLAEQLKDLLLEDEIGEITVAEENSFSVYLQDYKQSNHCTRILDKT